MDLRVFLLILTLGIVSCTPPDNTHPSEFSKDPVPEWALSGFVKADSLNPILVPSPELSFKCPVRKEEVRWESRNVLNPSAVVKDGKVYLIYRAQDQDMTSRLGLAVSEDGLHFEKQPEPIFYPGEDSLKIYEWKGGVEDPRIVESEDGTYILTYTAYDGKTARLFLASSRDLKTWTKHGLVLGKGKYKDQWSKSGAIVCRLEGDRVVAVKVDGKYWMYFGDTDLFMATSDDLIHWEVLENEYDQQMTAVLHPRKGYFDSRLVEPGPYAIVRDAGILLIYNAMNASYFNDTLLPPHTYAAGQALFDRHSPFKLIDRMDEYFIYPEKEYEMVGEVNRVVFVEGLVFFKGKWFLYYGTADSKIAVAVRDANSTE